jgi:hypothetical protein
MAERPTQEAVRAAAAATGDAELVSLTAAPGTPLLEELPGGNPMIGEYDLLVVNASHPPLLRVTFDRRSGAVGITRVKDGPS